MKAALAALLQQLPRLLMLAAVLLAARWLYTAGAQAGAADVQREWDRQTISGLAADRAQIVGALQRTAALGDRLDAIQSDNRKGHADAKRSSQTLLDDLRTGRIRLSVPAAGENAANEPGTGAGGAAAGPAEARTELDPATAANLVGITDDGDAAIRDLNACIDAFGAVRAKVNGQGAAP